MRTRAKTAIAAIGIVAVTLVGSDAMTYAGTGDSLILGKLNKSSKTTHINNIGKGPALSLHAKGNRPALAVDSKAKVVRLNADRVDGKHAAALQNNVRVYTRRSGSSSGGGGMVLKLPSFPNGRYQVSYDVYMDDAYGSVTTPTIARCYFQEDGRIVRARAYTSTTAEGDDAGLSGSGVLTKDGLPWMLVCAAYQPGIGGDDWSISPMLPIQVTLTRIDNTIGGKLTPDAARATARAPLSTGP